jgi:hypothetical protein
MKSLSTHITEALEQITEAKFEIEVSASTAKLAHDTLSDMRHLKYDTDGSTVFIFKKKSDYEDAIDALNGQKVDILESVTEAKLQFKDAGIKNLKDLADATDALTKANINWSQSGQALQFDKKADYEEALKVLELNEQLTEAKLSIAVTPETVDAALAILSDNRHIKDYGINNGVFNFTKKADYQDALMYFTSDNSDVELVDKKLAAKRKQESINISVYGALVVNFSNTQKAIDAILSDKASVLKKISKSLSHTKISKDELSNALDIIIANQK